MKRRLAYFSPLPPARTGIADYSRELIPHLAQLADLVVFSDQYDSLTEPSQDRYLAGLERYAPADYPGQRWEYDAAIYQMGNNVLHASIAANCLRYPGIVVLHDYGLHQLWASQTVARGNPLRYAREMAYALGPSGIKWAVDALGGRRPLPHFEVPLNDRFVDTALGVIVHSAHVAQLVRSHDPWQRVAAVHAPIDLEPLNLAPPNHARSESLRSQLGLPAAACVFGSFGVVSHTKQLEPALLALRAVRETNPECHYLIVGEWHPQDVDVPALVQRLGLQDAVTYTGYASSLSEFLKMLAAVDVVVNLRYPTVGETSAVALRALAAGRPLIVYDHGWYGELPESVCLKLPPLEQAALVSAMQRLADDPLLRAALGQHGQDYVRQQHSPAQAASTYIAFVEEVLARGSARFA